jgi:Protein of unknown function (DUF1800)
MRIPRLLTGMLASAIPFVAASAATAASCITVGVYQAAQALASDWADDAAVAVHRADGRPAVLAGRLQADRAGPRHVVGEPLSAVVNWLLSTPAGLSGPPATNGGKPLDPTGDDTDLVLSWIDRMVRSTNPFVERLTFLWHRHWANSRDQVSPPQLLITQNNLFRSYADFSANPTATFRKMADDVTVDPSMLRYLTGEDNVKGAPNENYARELMELFTLGVHDAGGRSNDSRTTSSSSPRRSPAGRSTMTTRTQFPATSRSRAGTTAQRWSSVSSGTSPRRKPSTSSSPVRPTRRS